MARCQRMDGVSVSPVGFHYHSFTESKSLEIDVGRFGFAVTAFRELHDAIRQYSMTNAQRQVGAIRLRTLPFPATDGRTKNAEHEGMVKSAWEDVRVVASKSAQLIHSLATLQRDKLSENGHNSTEMQELAEEQTNLEVLLEKNNCDTTTDSSLPTKQLFDPILQKMHMALVLVKGGPSAM